MNNLSLGAVLIGIGVLLLLDQWGLIDFWSTIRTWWPAALIVWGGRQMWLGSRLGGAVIAAVGVYLLGQRLGLLEPRSLIAFWPLILMGIGVAILMQGTASRRTRAGGHAGANLSAFFDDQELVLRRPFAGGQAFTLFGDAHLDLSGAEPASKESPVEVFLIFGDLEMTVPASWAVENRSIALFAGTRHSPGDSKELAQHSVVVRGLQLFGEVIVRRGPS